METIAKKEYRIIGTYLGVLTMNKNLQEIGTNIRPATDNLDAYIKEET
jgi:hypothetical protein